MIIDSHTHIFSPDVVSHRERYTSRDIFFAYLYSNPKARLVGVDEILAAMDAAGVDQAILAGWAWQRNDTCIEQNTWLMETAREHTDRLMVLASVQPSVGGDAVRELHRCIAGGAVGIGELNADGQNFRLDDSDFIALAREIAELGVPLLLHTNEPVGHVYPGKGKLPLVDVYALVKALPDLKLVLGHWGGGFPFYELMPEVRAVSRNVFYDSAASPLLYSIDIFRAVASIVGSDKVLFGSDFPLILYPKRQQEPSFAPFLEEIRGVGLASEDLANILGENARRIWTACMVDENSVER